MQHLAPNMSDAQRRKAMYAPTKCNLPSDAFADDVIDDDVGRYYPVQTQVVMHHSTLGDHLNINSTGRPRNDKR